MNAPTTKRDAVREIEERLGCDGTHELAERIVEQLGWQNAVRIADESNERQWNAIIDCAQATLEVTP